MGVTSVQLAEGRVANVVRLGSPSGRPVLYFHSPASSGEERDGAGEKAARELGIELVTVVRRSLAAHDAGGGFMAAVAFDADLVVKALGLESVAVFGWSGGAPYALAASERLGPVVAAVHLVSPLPGPLIGPDAVPHQSERLQQIATTSPTSSWVAAPGALRDYMAVVAPWPFDVSSVVQPVTIWAPTEDDIVPPRLVDHLARQLPHAAPMTGSWRTGSRSSGGSPHPDRIPCPSSAGRCRYRRVPQIVVPDCAVEAAGDPAVGMLSSWSPELNVMIEPVG